MLANPTTANRDASPSPSNRAGGGLFSSFGARITRTFSKPDDVNGGRSSDGESTVAGSVSPILGKQDRSLSRGREALQSTGRGGFGNIRQASVSRDRPGGPDDFSTTRGREREAPGHVGTPTIYSTGRGGAGNLRSPSREARTAGLDRREKEVIDTYVAHQSDLPISTGRGGLGNIARSRSRDPSGVRDSSRDPPRSGSRTRVATGRGGAGNIMAGDGYEANVADEVERGKLGGHVHEHVPHSTGRGGIANITEQDEPAVERRVAPHRESEYGSTGRGGAGNIVRN